MKKSENSAEDLNDQPAPSSRPRICGTILLWAAIDKRNKLAKQKWEMRRQKKIQKSMKEKPS